VDAKKKEKQDGGESIYKTEEEGDGLAMFRSSKGPNKETGKFTNDDLSETNSILACLGISLCCPPSRGDLFLPL
jgi:hypothetical protein